MKHPARHVSRHLRRVRRGQQAFSRQILHTAKRIQGGSSVPEVNDRAPEASRRARGAYRRIVGHEPMSARWTLSTRTRASDSDPSEAHRRTLIRHHVR